MIPYETVFTYQLKNSKTKGTHFAFYNSGSSRSEQIAEINILYDVKQGTLNGRNNGFNKFDQKQTS